MKVLHILKEKLIIPVLVLLFFTPVSSIAETTTYDFSTISTTENKAYMCDVDKFPFDGKSNFLNSKTAISDYDLIASSDDTRASKDPGGSYYYTDEMLIWVDMEVPEEVIAISEIEFMLEGNSEETNNFFIFVKKAFEDPFDNSSWVQIAGPVEISANEDGIITGAITYNFSDYIENGKITWVAGAVNGHNEILNVDYLKMNVTTAKEITSVNTFVYDFSSMSSEDSQAYLWDVDDFPFSGHTDYLNSKTEITDYSLIEASDADVASIDPEGDSTYGDEALIELNFTINEDPKKISKMKLVFEGYSSATNAFYIYAKKAGADPFINSSWDVVTGPVWLTANTEGVVIGEISNINPKDYIENGKITWLVGAPEGHWDALFVDYVRMEVEVYEGEIDMASIPNNKYAYIIQNKSDYALEGTFSAYYEASNITRMKVVHADLNISAQSESDILSLYHNDVVLDINLNELFSLIISSLFYGVPENEEVMLVFEGKLGSENDVIINKIFTGEGN